jgi:hypothetical protein
MPAQPFLDWLHQADPTSAELTLEDLRHEPTIYLLPEYDTEEKALGHLKKVYPSLCFCVLRRPAGNSNSAFRPVAVGAGRPPSFQLAVRAE